MSRSGCGISRSDTQVRKDGKTHFEILEKRGKLHIVRQPSRWSLTTGLGQRLEDLVESLVA